MARQTRRELCSVSLKEAMAIRLWLPYLMFKRTPRENDVRQERAGLKRKGWTMAWIYLVSAGVLEVIWALYMKKSEGLLFSGQQPSPWPRW